MAKRKIQPGRYQTVAKFSCCLQCATRAATDLRESGFKVKRHNPQLISVDAAQSEVDAALQGYGWQSAAVSDKAAYEFVRQNQ